MNVGIGISPFFGVKDLGDVQSYIARVLADSGEVASNAKLRELILMLKAQGLYDNTKLLIAPILGGKWRTSGIYKYASKLYSVNLAANDATQTAEVSQPYQSGNIAPNELLSIKNPNGDARYLSHPAISFAANEAWSVSVMVNDNYKSGSIDFSGGALGGLYTRISTGLKYSFINQSGTIYDFTGVNSSSNIGKNSFLTYIADGLGFLSLYSNGVLVQKISANTEIIYDKFFRGRTQAYFNGTSHYYRIQSGAMTQAQITAEYNLLRSWIAEIESVQIGSQTWATSNLAAVATPLGNVIPEVQTAGAVEKVTSFNFTTWGALGGGVVDDINSFSSTGVGGIQSNTLTPFVQNKWFKINITGSTTASEVRMLNGTGSQTFIAGLSGSFNVIVYVKCTVSSGFNMYLRNQSTGVTDITTLSIQELNWSNATEIYDAVYAATSGTAAEKHYAAVKEAAMWCHYDNSTANGAVYNKLYNWYAASLLDLDMAAAGYGWHVPTSAEFTTLVNALGGASVAGGKLKMTGTNYWNSPNTGADNSSGFTALGGGWRHGELGLFIDSKTTALFIVSDNVSTQNTYYLRCVSSTSETLTLNQSDKRRGYSIRLIKNT